MTDNRLRASVKAGRHRKNVEARSVGSVGGLVGPPTATEARVPTGNWHVWIAGRAASASRPRVARNGGVWFPDAHTRWQSHVARVIDCAMWADGCRGFGSAPVTVLLAFVLPAPRKPVPGAVPRGDLDNLVKLVLDGATDGGLWGDDTQVVQLSTSKRFAVAGEPAGVEMWVSPVRP